MKTIKYLSLIALALLLAGCDDLVTDKEDNPLLPQGGNISFDIGFAPTTRVSTGADFKSAWEVGDEIGLFAVRRASGASAALQATGNYIHNVKLTYTETTPGNPSTGSWIAAAELGYPTAGNVLDFYAYYPYDDNGDSPGTIDATAISFNVSANQSSVSNYKLSDLLTSKADNAGAGYAASTNPVPLTFTHALSLIQVEISSQGRGFGPDENLVVKLCGVKIKSTLDLSSSSVPAAVTLPTTGNDATNIRMYRVEQTGDANYESAYTYRALIPAQEVPSGTRMFRFEQDDALYTDAPLASVLNTLAPATAQKFERSLPATAIHRVRIPAAGKTFLMGSSNGSNYPNYTGGDLTLNTTPPEPGRVVDIDGDREIQHLVTLTKDFYMSKYEITIAQYAAFLNATGVPQQSPSVYGDVIGYGNQVLCGTLGSFGNPVWNTATGQWQAINGAENRPTARVTWYGAKAYADWVGGSLPTEAQWEYAARGGQTTSLPFGIGNGRKLTGDMANFEADFAYDLDYTPPGTYNDASGSSYTSSSSLIAVGYYSYANGYGLYDMHGSVSELCSDWYDVNYGAADAASAANPVTDPAGPAGPTSYRVVRGGSWFDHARACRSASRSRSVLDNLQTIIGFRVVFN